MKKQEFLDLKDLDVNTSNGFKSVYNGFKRCNKEIDEQERRKNALTKLIAKSNGNKAKIKRLEDKLEKCEGYLDFLIFVSDELELKFIESDVEYENLEE